MRALILGIAVLVAGFLLGAWARFEFDRGAIETVQQRRSAIQHDLYLCRMELAACWETVSDGCGKFVSR